MTKDIEWLKSAIQMNLDFYNDKDEEWQMAKVRAYAKALDLINQLDEPEVLSSDWIKDNQLMWASLGGVEYYVPVNKLYGKIVPDQEVLSEEWISERIIRNENTGEEYVYVDELQNVIVPKHQTVEVQELINKYSKGTMSTYDVKVERERFVNDLQNLLVPEQGEVDRAYKDGYEEGREHGFYKGYREGLADKGGEPETVADVIADFYESCERLQEVMSMEVEELEE